MAIVAVCALELASPIERTSGIAEPVAIPLGKVALIWSTPANPGANPAKSMVAN